MIYLLIFVFGLIMGSFYMVVGIRLPLKKSIIKPRSHCEKCNHYLKWYELIPVISFVLQKGKCNNCHQKISKFYPLCELLCGLLFLLNYIIFGFSFKFLTSILISSLMIIIFISDFKYYIILDSPILIASILYLILEFIFLDIKTTILSFCSGVTMFVIMILIMLLGNLIFKRESLGGGDIKLSFFIGMVLVPRLSLISLIFASFFALIYACIFLQIKKESEIPYGPFLMIGFYITFLLSPYLLMFLDSI